MTTTTRRPTYDLILAALANLEARSGDNLVFKVSFKESSGGEWDLLQYTIIVFNVKRKIDDVKTVITADLTSGLLVEGTNTLVFDIAGATMDVAGGNYEYEIIGSNASTIETLMGGNFRLRD